MWPRQGIPSGWKVQSPEFEEPISVLRYLVNTGMLIRNFDSRYINTENFSSFIMPLAIDSVAWYRKASDPQTQLLIDDVVKDVARDAVKATVILLESMLHPYIADGTPNIDKFVDGEYMGTMHLPKHIENQQPVEPPQEKRPMAEDIETDEIEIPSELVDKYYRMVPETDDVISGRRLQEGMVVLVESVSKRFALDYDRSEGERLSMQVMNRWCRVEDLTISGNSTQFIGVYADGYKHSRLDPITDGWIVKKDSIPPAITIEVACEDPVVSDPDDEKDWSITPRPRRVGAW